MQQAGGIFGMGMIVAGILGVGVIGVLGLVVYLAVFAKRDRER